ncbi:hypothetical protein [Xanthomonas oryzae]|uniref:hypothetical protein n=1 Tax=Xanthomonas oryzae TaxID=347 RepID=UPI000A508A5C|nr:hypothetical protein [Xanthomonas oryzae]UEQ18721.1 hypothetical protein KFK26_15055 [Xanthomonas oryzae]
MGNANRHDTQRQCTDVERTAITRQGDQRWLRAGKAIVGVKRCGCGVFHADCERQKHPVRLRYRLGSKASMTIIRENCLLPTPTTLHRCC